MKLPLFKNPELQFSAITFFAKQHQGETCGSNGLPLTPNSIIIFGKAQLLKTITHPYLCEYLDIVRGKHERTIVVSQFCGKPLSDILGNETLSFHHVKKIAFQLFTALNVLHKKKIVHRNLSLGSILMQNSGDIKLFNYGLYYMTNNGELVSFPIMKLSYSAPEVYLTPKKHDIPTFKVDIWSVGIVLVELLLNKQIWCSLKLGQKIRKILSFYQCGTSIFEKIAREHNCFEVYQNVPEELRNIVEKCLQIHPQNRPTCEEFLSLNIFSEFKNVKVINSSRVCEPFQAFTLRELYHWWKLAGGDVTLELKKQGLIRSTPPILSLPLLVTLDGTIMGQGRNPATLYDSRIVHMSLDTLYQRFEHIPFNACYPLLHTKSDIISSFDPVPYDTKALPLVIKEKDPEYQFHRIILFRRLLHGYPFTKEIIREEAKKDIPPLLRGEIWAALLGIQADYEKNYAVIDKETVTATDRQIEVDIPRCHQYNELLSSTEGHIKLRRILKAWVQKNTQYVYWQGLDSLTAPFLYLNFNDEAKAYACLSAFVPKYVHKFFLKDNSVVIREYLAKFSQLIAFHDPELANHLYDINFYPELFAIPWFLTVFSHVFPLYKILHVWDNLLLGDSSFPLHIGLSVLTQLRAKLLTAGFNDCILLFSDLPEVDIEKSINYSIDTFRKTPKSITSREHQNENFCDKTEYDISGVTLEDLNRERCPRISAADTVELLRNSPDRILIVDIRNPVQFSRCSVKNSINIPFSSVTFGENNIDGIGSHAQTLRSSGDKNVVIVGSAETDLELFPKFLLNCCISHVCVLHGGFDILASVTPTVLISTKFES
ncbi:TBC domain-containing protein kinase-like protein [Coccinella septempunctata]|uniref:TBC domain-containing protein kinase-like protein n=1 Tax=Coccinella septempunctata TaxID=41139 RepID=UPI001D07547A|nr:TBC domain-containing protein kinase-like protein [Coccinella septempunctata]